jgi:hypothetical protein
VLAVAWDDLARDGVAIVGPGVTNPSSPGEEELSGPLANRCSAFKDMNGGAYVDAPYAAAAAANGWTFTSPDGRVSKTITLADRSATLDASYAETLDGPLYLRLGLSPNPLDLMLHGHEHLAGTLDAASYRLQNSAGGGALVTFGGTTFNPSPSDAGFRRRNLALTEEVELSGDGTFAFSVALIPGASVVAAPPPAAAPAAFAVQGPWPSPARGAARLELALPERAHVRVTVLDVAGRSVRADELGARDAGRLTFEVAARDARGLPLPAGVYLVRVEAGGRSAVKRWVVMD